MAAAEKTWAEIKAWRRAAREDLVAHRVAMPQAEHRAASAAIHAHLMQGFALPAGAVLAFCWPFKHEFDVRFAVRAWREQGVTATLPVVAGKAQPLQFGPVGAIEDQDPAADRRVEEREAAGAGGRGGRQRRVDGVR